MSLFAERLGGGEPEAERRWIFVPYDQLSQDHGLLADADPAETGLVLIESRWKARRRPYHRQKLALVLTNLRHFALEQQERGFQVLHRAVDTPYGEELRRLADELGTLEVMRPAEYELRRDLAPLFESGALVERPNTLWATDGDDFPDAPPWRMDRFYRAIRRRYGWLMEDDKPVGGRFSFDGDNREPWSGEPPAPEPPEFEVDDLTEEVCTLVEEHFGDHPGELRPRALPASRDDAEAAWAWALEHCLESFGPYEDAMSTRSRGLFHTRISPLLNLGRLHPRRLAEDVLATSAPLSSREGFLRQVVGWREFVRHVHETTDGFRRLEGEAADEVALTATGDGGYGRWRGEPFEASDEHFESAAPSHLAADDPLPAAFWGEPSGLRCLDRVVADVWHEGWSHHITRLMVLCNLATLLDLSPRQLTDWFWVAYIDAYDWVVEPNVLAMGTYAVGPLMTTKPYVSGAAYIDRMSDYCGECAFDPKKTCPWTHLYWAFLERHRDRLEGNPRVALPLRSLAKRGSERRAEDAEVFRRVRRRLADGERLTPDELA